MKKNRVAWLLFCLLMAILSLVACGGGSVGSVTPPPTPAGPSLTGSVHVGQTAVSGAAIQLYAAGNTGYGSQATPLLATSVTSDANGNFALHYACPSSSALIYLVAIGGNPGLSAGTNNAALTMMAALGPCGSLGSSCHSLHQRSDYGHVGFRAGAVHESGRKRRNEQHQHARFGECLCQNQQSCEYQLPEQRRDHPCPAGATSTTATLNTIANILNDCTGSPGTCSALFSAATPRGATAPTNTIDAALAIALNPGLNPGALYALTPASPPFQPALAQAPTTGCFPSPTPEADCTGLRL